MPLCFWFKEFMWDIFEICLTISFSMCCYLGETGDLHNLLQGAHGFMKTSRWRDFIGAAINVEASGTGGPGGLKYSWNFI